VEVVKNNQLMKKECKESTGKLDVGREKKQGVRGNSKGFFC
jgi:hypothetical protein